MHRAFCDPAMGRAGVQCYVTTDHGCSHAQAGWKGEYTLASWSPLNCLPEGMAQSALDHAPLLYCGSAGTSVACQRQSEHVGANHCVAARSEDWPPDADSCCGDTLEEAAERLAELREPALVNATFGACEQAAGISSCRASSHWQQQQQAAYSISCGHSSGHCSTGDVVRMGDDFECLASEDASILLDDASIEYPGGVDAALADWAAACSQDQPASASAGPAAGHSMDLCLRKSPPAVHLHHPATHAGIIPSLAALLVSPTPPPCYADNMLPCCQWGAFPGDAVGDVLAGRVPAPSCCSSGGLTDCLMECLPA